MTEINDNTPKNVNNMGFNGIMKDLLTEKNAWDPFFIKLQKKAPRPLIVALNSPISRPLQFGLEYHGQLNRRQAEARLNQEGEYLVRNGRTPDQYTLSLRVNGVIHHYHLQYDGQYFLRPEKKFGVLENLVAEGLMVHFLDYHQSVNQSINNSRSHLTIMPEAAVFEEPRHLTLRHHKNFKGDRSVARRRHVFRPHTFGWLNKCDVCGLREFGNQCVKCEDCGYGAHQKCSETVIEECLPGIKRPRAVFGVELATLVQALGTTRPFIVDMCIEEIERRGLEAEGLYRVSGFSDEIEALKCAFDKDGDKTDISPSAYDNIHVITGVLKRWLRHSPSPLISTHVQPALFDALKKPSEHEIEDSIKVAVRKLEPANFETLKYLMQHLHRVVAKTETNRMTSFNMAVVFGPTLMFSDDFPSLNNNIKVVELLINKCNNIFS